MKLSFYIIGTHSNNVLIWFTKRILGTVFFVSIFCVSQMTITHIFLKATTPIVPELLGFLSSILQLASPVFELCVEP